MILEFNEVLIEGERQTLSFLAHSGEITVLTGGSDEQQTRWLMAAMGFSVITHGFVCIDGEPLTSHSAAAFRKFMAYTPLRLGPIGEVCVYEPPSVQDVFNLQANRSLPISNGILGEEMRRIGVDTEDERVHLLAVSVLLNKPILLINQPPVGSIAYLHSLAEAGKLVLVTSNDNTVIERANHVVEL